jgi:two-component system response regulator FixJ
VEPTPVCVIDDDPDVAALSVQILSEAGFQARAFTSAGQFLDSPQAQNCLCIVSDLRMPGVTGGELLDRLRHQQSTVSVVIVTAFADVKTAVSLMQHGATSLLEKPFEAAELIDVVRRAVELTRRRQAEVRGAAEFRRRLSQLTEESRAVLDCMVAGLSNKAIAAKLDISARTLDRRKQMILSTLQVETVPELIAAYTKAVA